MGRARRARWFGNGTHSLRRTKPAQIYRNTGNLRAVQLLLGHAKLESTVRYLGIEVDDALTISESCRGDARAAVLVHPGPPVPAPICR
jgi:integrase